MAGNRQKLSKSEKNLSKGSITRKLHKYCSISFAKELLTDARHTMTIGWFLIILEFVLNIFIVSYVPYTEIDWKAYMQECEGFLNGTWDYTKLKGDTGPLVYPAGFVYLYSALYFITSQGTNIRLAQYIFVALYLIQLYLTLKLYARTKKVPPYAIILVTLTSYRVHSLYSLRLFNDPWAVVLFFGALHCFLSDWWTLGSVLYSLAVGIKMNILLYAPCLLVAYFACCGGVYGAIKHISICALVQLLLGAPFLITNFRGYLEGSFDVRRVFEHRWTVNFRFIPREMFENRMFHLSLLGLHLILLGLFLPLLWRYLRSYSKLKQIEGEIKPQLKNKLKNVNNNNNNKKHKKPRKDVKKFNQTERSFLNAFETGLKHQQQQQEEEEQENKDDTFTIDFSTSTQLLVLPFLVTNLIGMSCARSLHYQFYSWYFHGLLYLGWSTRWSPMAIFLLLGILEACWNTYPSTVTSSAALHLCHLLLLIGVYRNMRQSTLNKDNLYL